MIYAQLRENERTARYEVKVVPGNRCEPVTDDAALAGSATKSKTKKAESATAWHIGRREDACWVDLEAELRHFAARAPIDLGLTPGERGGAGGELLARLEGLTEDLYRIEALESFMQYLGILNLFEYLRLVSALDQVGQNATQAGQVGIIGPEYFAQRKIALQLDLAEITEWLVAHGIGLPDLAIFYPNKYSTPAAEEAPKKRGKKKSAEAEGDEETAAQMPIPEALRYVVELIRLQQATMYDLVRFVDDVKQRNNYETVREAIELMQREVAPWIDIGHVETMYESMKREEQLATIRQQQSIERQRQAFEARPRRGKGGRPERKQRPDRHQPRQVVSPLEEFAEGIEENSDEAYERAMERALSQPEGLEFVPEEFAQNGHEIEGEESESEAEAPAHGGRKHDRRRDRGRPVAPREGADLFAEGDAEGGEDHNAPQSEDGGEEGGGDRFPHGGRRHRRSRARRRPHPGGGGAPGGGGGGGRRGPLDYDEVQPVSNYTPGLPASAQPGALPAPPAPRGGGGGPRSGGGGKPKRRWRGRR